MTGSIDSSCWLSAWLSPARLSSTHTPSHCPFFKLTRSWKESGSAKMATARVTHSELLNRYLEMTSLRVHPSLCTILQMKYTVLKQYIIQYKESVGHWRHQDVSPILLEVHSLVLTLVLFNSSLFSTDVQQTHGVGIHCRVKGDITTTEHL